MHTVLIVSPRPVGQSGVVLVTLKVPPDDVQELLGALLPLPDQVGHFSAKLFPQHL